MNQTVLAVAFSCINATFAMAQASMSDDIQVAQKETLNEDADEVVAHLILGFEGGEKVDIRSPQFAGVRVARKVSDKPLTFAVDENGVAKDGSSRSREISSLSVTTVDGCTFRVRVQIFDNPNLGPEMDAINEKTGQSSHDSVYEFDFSGLTAVSVAPIFDGVAEEVRFQGVKLRCVQSDPISFRDHGAGKSVFEREGVWTRSRDFLLPYRCTDEAKVFRQRSAHEAFAHFRERICKPKS